MEQFQPDPKNDIAKEPFKGTGPFVAGAGYMYLSHLATTIAGILLTGFVAYHAHAPINRWIASARELGARVGGFREKTITFLFGVKPGSHELNRVVEEASSINSAHREKILELVSKEERGLFEGMAAKVAERVSKSKRASKFLEGQSEDKLAASFIGGGLGGVAGWIGSTIWAARKGGHESNTGKRQFKRAQTEIKELRETNDDLEKINDKLHKEVVEASTRFKDISAKQDQANLRVAPDADVTTPNEKENTAKKETPATATLSAVQHHGKLAAANAAEPEMA